MAEGIPSVALGGELDVSTAPKAESAVRRIESDKPPVMVLDLSGLTFLDSSGLRLVLEADNRARRDGRRFVLVPGPPEVQRVFRVTLVDSRLDFVQDPESLGEAHA